MPTREDPKTDELQTVAQLRRSLSEFAVSTAATASRHGLTSRRYDLCLLIESSEGGVIGREIAEALYLSPNAASELITRAELEGLVTRTSAAADARRKPLALTSEGRRRFLATFEDLRPERARLIGILRESVDLASRLL